MANSVDPDETAHYKLSNLDLHFLQRYPCWSAGDGRFNMPVTIETDDIPIFVLFFCENKA